MRITQSKRLSDNWTTDTFAHGESTGKPTSHRSNDGNDSNERQLPRSGSCSLLGSGSLGIMLHMWLFI